MKKLDRKFFNQDTLKVAQGLLGKYIVRVKNGRKIMGKIVETEAYMGFNDLASHASKGKTKRTELMFGNSGMVYIYLIYGMYYCFNIVTEKKDFPAAVLIRALEPIFKNSEKLNTQRDITFLHKLANGPGKLSRYLEINKTFNGEDVINSKKLWIEDNGCAISKKDIISTERVGVGYAKHCANYPWRFYIRDNLFISKK